MVNTPVVLPPHRKAGDAATVKITYDVETGGAMEKCELPFVVGIFADLSGDRLDDAPLPQYKLRKMMDIDRDNFNSVMAHAQATVNLGTIKRTLPKDKPDDSDTLDGALYFTSLADFAPLSIVKAVPVLHHWYSQRDQGNQSSAYIDLLLSTQLRAIMHAPCFQALEATWRSLHDLVTATNTSTMLKLRVFNATRDELSRDMAKAVEFDQSILFKLIYEDEFGTYGGHPYGLLVGGYEIGADEESITFLRNIAAIAAASHAPFIAAASASMFGLENFRDLPKPRELVKIFEGVEFEGWREFCDSEDSRYVTLVLPHVLLRLPYGKGGRAADGVDFEELPADTLNNLDPDNFLWGNAVYKLAQRITSAFSRYHWTAAIHGIDGGGMVENLPLYRYQSASGAEELLCPTEVPISDRRESELGDLGFMPLCHCKDTAQAAFIGGHTTHRPKLYFDESATANARASAKLPYMLAASRFAHYIKVIMRQKIGSFLTRANVEAYLNTWLSNYILLEDDAPENAKASYPLRHGNVVVTDVPGSPGSYSAVVFLQPHYQLAELTGPIRLVVHLPQ